MTSFLVLSMLLTVEPRVQESTAVCTTVADCWLDDAGAPIARPKKFKGRKLPRASCQGAGLNWLRHMLSCDPEKKVCVALDVGDRC